MSYQQHLQSYGHCKRGDKLAGLASYIKGTAKPDEPKTKGASALSLVNPAVSGPRFGNVERSRVR